MSPSTIFSNRLTPSCWLTKRMRNTLCWFAKITRGLPNWRVISPVLAPVREGILPFPQDVLTGARLKCQTVSPARITTAGGVAIG